MCLTGWVKLVAEEGSFGIAEVDQLLGGSLLRGKSYLLEADNGTQPQSLVFAFTKYALNHGELVVYASNEQPPEDVMTRLQDSGVDVDEAIKAEQLILLDLWSEKSEKEEPLPGILRVGNPGDPHKVMFVYTQAYNYILERQARTPSRVIIESFSGTVTNFGFERGHRLASRVVRMMKLVGAVGLSVLVPKIHPATVSESFKHLHDGVIQLTLIEVHDKLQKFLRILKSPRPLYNTRRIPYDITPDGITFPSTKGIESLLNDF